MKHGDWFLLVPTGNQQQVELQSYGSFDGRFRSNNYISFYDTYYIWTLMFMSYIWAMKKSSTTLLNNTRFYSIHMIGDHIFYKSTFVYLCWWLDMNLILLAHTHCHLHFIIEFVGVLLDFTQQTTCIHYVANVRGS